MRDAAAELHDTIGQLIEAVGMHAHAVDGRHRMELHRVGARLRYWRAWLAVAVAGDMPSGWASAMRGVLSESNQALRVLGARLARNEGWGGPFDGSADDDRADDGDSIEASVDEVRAMIDALDATQGTACAEAILAFLRQVDGGVLLEATVLAWQDLDRGLGRVALMNVLGERKLTDPRVFELLLAWLANTDSAVGAVAEMALGAYGDSAAVPYLLDALDRALDHLHRDPLAPCDDIVEALANLGARPTEAQQARLNAR